MSTEVQAILTEAAGPQAGRKVAVIFDGFNFYYGLKNHFERFGVKYYWQDLCALSSRLAKSLGLGEVVHIEYCTAKIKGPDSVSREKAKRQSSYLNLLEACGIKISYGEFVTRSIRCPHCNRNPAICQVCGSPMQRITEKQSDVNLAVRAASLLLTRKCDYLIVVSADLDLLAVGKLGRELEQDTGQRVFFALPMGQDAREEVQVILKRNSSGLYQLTESDMRFGLMRTSVTVGTLKFGCPKAWREGNAVKPGNLILLYAPAEDSAR